MKATGGEKPECPRCRSRDVLPIVYGLPGFELALEEQQGKVVLGGCCVAADGTDPRWACRACGNRWR